MSILKPRKILDSLLEITQLVRVYSTGVCRLICEKTFQAVFRRMKGQGFNRSHVMPNEYNRNSIKYILGSPKTVIYLSEIETFKMVSDVRYTTISGTFFLELS